MKIKYFVLILVVIVVAGILLFLGSREVDEKNDITATYSQDTEIPGDYTIASGERVILANGSWLTVKGDLNIDGQIECANGPLGIKVEGKLMVNGKLDCTRNDELSDENVGLGISLVALGDIEFSDSAVVVSNGHVQLVDDENNLVKTEEEINELYDDAGTDTGDEFRVGPFIPIELEESVVEYKKQNNLLYKLSKLFVKTAHAVEAARDIDNLPVANTVKIGGTWIVGGWPTGPVPPGLTIPTPPKKVKKIILNFNFGANSDVALQSFELSGPDGRPGKDDLRQNCDSKGTEGENAFRFRVQAINLTINNFTLNLGSGGQGGWAETKQDCSPGKAKGGKGGEAGNFKMTGSRNFSITGDFRIRPGQGGQGGNATAFGKDGKDGCPGEIGSDAYAYGGEGGENKKGLKVKGTVQGLGNIIIEDIIGGRGGDAYALGGFGGLGTGGKCDGGMGGFATAVGGEGGNAASKTVVSHGGDGGDAEAIGGDGGFGGTGDAKTPGGHGGFGGDAFATPGEGGKAKTVWGAQGNYTENGGDGGNGGDGCPEGKGGEGGKAENPGNKGKDGKNICPPPPKKNIKVGNDVKPEDKKDDAGGVAVPQPVGIQIVPLSLVGTDFTFEHIIGKTKCPTPIGSTPVKGTDGYSWKVNGTPPMWLELTGTSGAFPGTITIAFSCMLDEYKTQELNTTLPIQQFDTDGKPVGDPVNINVSGYIQGE